MFIGIDAMGGDYAPTVVVEGVLLSLDKINSDSNIVLFGQSAVIRPLIPQNILDSKKITIIDSPEVIDMSDHPAKSFQKKPNSSIAQGFSYLKRDKIDGFASAGSTGAMMAGSMLVIGAIEGVTRPTICTPLATTGPHPLTLLDVGLNADCKPHILNQYAILGSIYSKALLGVINPRVGLLNIGEESEKGNLITKATYPLLADNTSINFVGNVEGNHLFDNSKADVIVCDGFSGNTIIKQIEGIYTILKSQGVENEWLNKQNYELVGGTPVLGINKPVIIGHGHSNAKAICTMVLLTEQTIKSNLTTLFKIALN